MASLSSIKTEVSYEPGAIVWVKCNIIWRPAEVQGTKQLNSFEQNIMREKKATIVVKFFGENDLGYLNSKDQIHHYNSIHKDEFIKKGLGLYQRDSKRFLEDVKMAEIKTRGKTDYIKKFKFNHKNNSPSTSGAPGLKRPPISQNKIKSSSGDLALPLFPCHFCDVSCKNIDSLIIHMRFHMKGFI